MRVVWIADVLEEAEGKIVENQEKNVPHSHSDPTSYVNANN